MIWEPLYSRHFVKLAMHNFAGMQEPILYLNILPTDSQNNYDIISKLYTFSYLV